MHNMYLCYMTLLHINISYAISIKKKKRKKEPFYFKCNTSGFRYNKAKIGAVSYWFIVMSTNINYVFCSRQTIFIFLSLSFKNIGPLMKCLDL